MYTFKHNLFGVFKVPVDRDSVKHGSIRTVSDWALGGRAAGFCFLGRIQWHRIFSVVSQPKILMAVTGLTRSPTVLSVNCEG